MKLNQATVLKNLELKKCLISGKYLKSHEAIVSKDSFPYFYDGTLDSKEKNLLTKLIEVFVSQKEKIMTFNIKTEDFYHRALNLKDKCPDELFLQSYVYLFWDTIEFRDHLIKPTGEVFWCSDNTTQDNYPEKYHSLILKIKKLINIDLISIDLKAGVLFLIEIKRDQVDDRAIGQILRYYEACRPLLLDRRLNLNYIKPIIVSKDISIQQWKGLPRSYSDIIEFYVYKFIDNLDENKDVLQLVNQRKKLLSEL